MEYVRFEIYSEKIEIDTADHYFSENERYDTKMYDNNIMVHHSMESFYDITNNPANPIYPYSYAWREAVVDYIYGINRSKEKNFDKEIKFEILDIDSREACQFKEYVSGKMIKEGRGWRKDLRMQKEKDAWDAAVIEYKKSHGMKTATGEMEKEAKEVTKAVESMDSELPKDMPTDIMSDIPKFDNPCHLISDILKSVNLAISVVGNFEKIAYKFKNLQLNTYNNTVREVKNDKLRFGEEYEMAVDSTARPDYFAELDARMDEYTKTHANDVAIFEACIYQEVHYGGTIKDVINGESSTTSYTEMNIDTDISKYKNMVGNEETRNYITFEAVAKTGRLYGGYKNEAPSELEASRIVESINECFLPLRLAWKDYCAKKGYKNSAWSINSGFRCKRANEHVGGSRTSAHMQGFAIDIAPYNGSVSELGEFLYNYLKMNKDHMRIDQLLVETPKDGAPWVHLGYKHEKDNGVIEQRMEYYNPYYLTKPHGEKKII